jgi:hypothetical protein
LVSSITTTPSTGINYNDDHTNNTTGVGKLGLYNRDCSGQTFEIHSFRIGQCKVIDTIVNPPYSIRINQCSTIEKRIVVQTFTDVNCQQFNTTLHLSSHNNNENNANNNDILPLCYYDNTNVELAYMFVCKGELPILIVNKIDNSGYSTMHLVGLCVLVFICISVLICCIYVFRNKCRSELNHINMTELV